MESELKVPKTLTEAIKYFSDPDTAHRFFVKMRWPNGVACPYCGCMDLSFISTRRVWQCKGCKKRFSAKVGSIMEDSPLKLETWLTATWLITGAKNGISSCEVARALGICQKTAWFLLHRVRFVMERGSFEKLDGEVEIDETFIGGKAKNMHGGKRQEMREKGFPKTTILGMREREGDVRTMVVSDTQKETLQAEIDAHVEKDATIFTDTARAYNGLSDRYEHYTVDHSAGQYVKEYEDGTKAYTNGIEGYWNLLDRCYHGTYVQMSPQHQHRYLAEQDFRYNTRKEKDGERFAEAMKQTTGKRLTYKALTQGHLQTMERG